MYRKIAFFLALNLLVSVSSSQGQEWDTTENQFKIPNLLASIPKLDTSDRSLESFEISGILPSPTSPTHSIHATIGWSRKNGSALLLKDASSKIPLLWASSGEAIICDFASKKLKHVKTIHPQASLGLINGDVKYNYRLFPQMVNHVIDLTSFPRNTKSQWKIASTDGIVRASSTSQSGRSELELRFSKKPDKRDQSPSFTGLEIRTAGASKVVLISINSISINRPLSAALQKIPLIAFSKNKIPLEHIVIQNRSEIRTLQQPIGRAFAMPLLVKQDASNFRSQRKFFENVDWNEAEQRYKAIGPKLVRILNELDATPSGENLATKKRLGEIK